ncbi:MAG TPA: type II toxin-antitoxin system VapC family toxin [Rhizomicrobium sp.]|jgi:predicted nucleic acid-binding protein
MTAAQECVLDASITLAWALPDEASSYSDSMLKMVASGKAWVPDLWPHEVANGLLMAQRRKRLSPAQRALFIEELLKLPIEVAGATARVVLESQGALAERYALTAHDAAYLDLALRKGIPLATQDKALSDAAKRSGIVLAGAH